jgi:FecR protein
MKFKFIAALLGLGLMIAIPGAVLAQNDQPMDQPNDQPTDQDSQAVPAPNYQEYSPSQGPQGPTDPGSNDANSGGPSYNTSAPEEKNGVARISLIHGDVSTQRGDTGSWSAAALNAPVLAGDRVSTGDKARTEVQLDYANMLRLAEHSQANINTLNRSQIQIQLGRGMANYTVLRNSDADAEIDTPNVSIRTEKRESSFRILVTADDHTEVLVRKGEVEVTTPQGGTRVGQNQFITIQGAGEQAQYKIGEAPSRDDFDQWNADRDNMIRNSLARRKTNDYYVGSEDLDNRGTWSEVPDYGQVWRPTETDPDWAPYRNGRWVYEPYWGWTWVSYDDWGWAPYHYGRWMYINGGWGWWPGPVYAYPYYQPIWAPAYVSFFGWGGGLGFGFGGGWGSVGWLPLGPCDHFHPWWGRWGGGRFGEGRFNDFNRGGFAPLHGGTRFSNMNLAMHDQHFRGGTTVSGRGFGGGSMKAQPMTHAQFQNARFSTGRLPMTPSRESFSASGRPAAPSTTRNVAQNQHFFSPQSNTAASQRSSMGQSQVAGARRSEAPNQSPQQRSQQSSQQRSQQSAGPRGNSNWGSTARPGNSGSSMAPRETAGGNSGGWQKFSPMSPRTSPEATRPESTRQGSGSNRPESTRQEQTRGSGSYSAPRGSSPEGRGYSAPSRSYSGSARPQLNMRQPIVTQRSYGGGGYRGGPYGGERPAPSYSAPRGGYGGGGGRPAPSYGGGRGGYSGGGGHSAPSSHGGGGGGSSHGGGSSSHSSGGGGKHGR